MILYKIDNICQIKEFNICIYGLINNYSISLSRFLKILEALSSKINFKSLRDIFCNEVLVETEKSF